MSITKNSVKAFPLAAILTILFSVVAGSANSSEPVISDTFTHNVLGEFGTFTS